MQHKKDKSDIFVIKTSILPIYVVIILQMFPWWKLINLFSWENIMKKGIRNA